MEATEHKYTNEEHDDVEHDIDEHNVEESNGEVNDKNVVSQPEEQSMPSSQEEEVAIKKKYGGIMPKKRPLISKDHERAFFDSADWALGKQGAPLGQKPKGPLEALRPKLQPTPHQQVRSRRSSYARTEGDDGATISSEDATYNE